MELPDWANLILDNEPEISNPTEWLEKHGKEETFDDFYRKHVEKPDSLRFNPSENRANSIAKPPYNCESAATVGGLVGNIIYDKEFDILADYSFGNHGPRPHTHQPKFAFNSHTALKDSEGEIYGGSQDKNSQELPLEKIAGIYLTNLALEAPHKDELGNQEEYLDQIPLEMKSEYAGATRKAFKV
jgi:hypothetical protein